MKTAKMVRLVALVENATMQSTASSAKKQLVITATLSTNVALAAATMVPVIPIITA